MSDFLDWDDLATDVDDLLAEFQEITLTRTAATYDPATSSTGTPTETVQTGSGAEIEYDSRDIDGTLVKVGDKKLLLSAVDFTEPQAGDVVTVGANTYTVIRCKPTNPAGTAVLYQVQVRA
jgi:hypothetical protein